MGTSISKIKGINLCSLSRKSSLDAWFYNLVQCDIDSLTDFDIGRMLRQDVFLDIAIPKALERLAADPFCGSMYDGQMMKNLIEAISRNPTNQKNSFYISLSNYVHQAIDNYNWADCDDTDNIDEFKELVIQFNELFPRDQQNLTIVD